MTIRANHDDKKGAEHAHDATPVYGGAVSVVKDVNYELVAKEDSITLYVTGHGKPVDTKDGSAALTLCTVVGEPVRKYLFYKLQHV